MSVLCRIYEEVCFQDLRFVLPFSHHDKMQEMLCIDCKKRKQNWMPDVQINSKSADLCRSDSPWVEDDVAWPNHCMLWGLWVSSGRKVKEPDQSWFSGNGIE